MFCTIADAQLVLRNACTFAGQLDNVAGSKIPMFYGSQACEDTSHLESTTLCLGNVQLRAQSWPIEQSAMQSIQFSLLVARAVSRHVADSPLADDSCCTHACLFRVSKRRLCVFTQG